MSRKQSRLSGSSSSADLVEFELSILQGRDLVAMDVNIFGKPTTSDPYVKIYVDGNLVGRTGVKSKTLAPVWNETFHIRLTPADAGRINDGDRSVGKLVLHLLDRDFLTADDNMGVVRLCLADVLSSSAAGNKETWYPVVQGSMGGVKVTADVTGEVMLKFSVPKLPTLPFSEVYQLGKDLGEGAFSVVKEGTHKRTRQTYAIKIVMKSKLSREDEIALVDEIGILKDLKHPHIIRLFEVFEDPRHHYLVTEIMDGGELFDRVVQKSYYNEKEARDVIKILIDALRYCHFRNIAHRDLKPENLLLVSGSSDSDVKIADFGFAKRVKSDACLTTQCGTPGYVAPEILEGVPYGTQADMWSLGVIMYILLGGYPPFLEENQKELFRKIRMGYYEFHDEYWGEVSTEAKNLISQFLTVDPRRRLTAERAMRDPWILQSDEALAGKDLGANLEKFRAFNAKRKFKAAVKVVIASNKMSSLGENFMANLS